MYLEIYTKAGHRGPQWSSDVVVNLTNLSRNVLQGMKSQGVLGIKRLKKTSKRRGSQRQIHNVENYPIYSILLRKHL